MGLKERALSQLTTKGERESLPRKYEKDILRERESQISSPLTLLLFCLPDSQIGQRTFLCSLTYVRVISLSQKGNAIFFTSAL